MSAQAINVLQSELFTEEFNLCCYGVWLPVSLAAPVIRVWPLNESFTKTKYVCFNGWNEKGSLL